MRSPILTASCVAFLVLCAAATLRAADLSDQDKKFVGEAGSGGLLEVRLGQYASANAASPDVRKFAEHMIEDHTKAANELKSIAAQKPLEIPRELSDEDKTTLDALEKLKGPEFDKAYVEQMVKDHRKDIAAFEKEISEGADSSIKAFADKLLPVLKHHLEMAENMNGKP